MTTRSDLEKSDDQALLSVTDRVSREVGKVWAS